MPEATEQPAVNSPQWWDHYFREHWERNGGAAQTRYFMRLIVDHLPANVRNCLLTESLTVLDWGCAFGEGVDELSQAFPKTRVYGVDTSEEAIRIARRRFAAYEFQHAVGDSISDRYHVIVSSNCLEHFKEPIVVLQEHLHGAEKLVIALVPFGEEPLAAYHFTRFTEDTFPENLDGFHRIACRVIETEPQFWCGRQLMVVYASDSQLKEVDLVDSLVDSATQSLCSISEAARENDKLRMQLTLLEEELAELREQLARGKETFIRKAHAAVKQILVQSFRVVCRPYKRVPR